MVVWVVVGYVCPRCLLDLGLYICGGLVWFLRLVVVAFWYGLLMDACGLAGVAGGGVCVYVLFGSSVLYWDVGFVRLDSCFWD